jgi:hypothetical protein
MLKQVVVNRGLVKSDLRIAPAIVPKIRLHGSLILGLFWRFLVDAGLVGDLVLLGQPSPEIDEPAAIATKWPVSRIRRPLDRPLARRTLDRRCHDCQLSRLGTARQPKLHVSFHMRRAAGGIRPVQESDGAAVLASAHLWKQVGVRR